MKKSVLFFLFFYTLPFLAQAQWTRMTGVENGHYGSYLCSVGDSLFVTSGRGIYFSTNDGDSWSLLNTIPADYIWGFTTDGKNIVCKNPQTNGNVFFSRNTGKSWAKLITVPDTTIYEVYTLKNYIYTISYPKGLSRTNDLGKTWLTIKPYNTTFLYNLYQSNNLLLSPTSEEGMLLSADFGNSWKIIGGKDKVGGYTAFQDSLIISVKDNLIHSSKNLGKTWDTYSQSRNYLSSGYNLFIHKKAIYIVESDAVYRSDDFGKTWTETTKNDQWGNYDGFGRGNNVFILGTGNGIIKSNDKGITWKSCIKGIETNPEILLKDPTDNQVYASDFRLLFKLKSNLKDWKLIDDKIPREWSQEAMIIHNDNILLHRNWNVNVTHKDKIQWGLASNLTSFTHFPFNGYFITWKNQVFLCGENSNELFVSNNNGVTFSLYEPKGATGIIAVANDNGKTLYGTDTQKFYKQVIPNTQWEQLAIKAPTKYLNFQYGKNFWADNKAFCIGSGLSSKLDTLYFSFNEGSTWKKIILSHFPPNQWNSYIQDFFYKDGITMLSTSQGLFISNNQGDTWTELADGFPYKNCGTSFLFVGEYIYANCDGSVWKRPVIESGLQAVSGKIFFDKNKNGLQDSDEIAVRNTLLESTISKNTTSITSDGSYSLFTTQKTENLKVTPPASYWTVGANNKTTSTPATNINFPITLQDGVKADLSVSGCNAGVLRPGFETNYVITWANELPITMNNVRIEFTFPPKLMTYLSSVPQGVLTKDSVLIWSFNEVKPYQTGRIDLVFKVLTTTPLMSNICVKTSIYPFDNDNNLRNNKGVCCSEVRGSFDPNDKSVTPKNNFTPQQVVDREELTYKIRFQNTGNYPAEFIKIRDTLSTDFDWSSFRFIGSSHPCTWTMKGRGELEFSFDNIQLPDSTTNLAASQGFVQYAVKPKSNISIGASLKNRAFIYFDYNQPIETNTTKTIIKQSVKTFDLNLESNLLLFPNPATDEVTLQSDFDGIVSLFDLNGKMIFQRATQERNLVFSVKNLAKQVYFVQIIGKNQTQSSKLIVD
jgi:photosystem II stability/assembly factor-like uncharacterized protein